MFSLLCYDLIIFVWFKELHNIQKGKRSKNKYPHRLSRKGYANLEAELVRTK
jgi:hypothetical protein